jgi:hypothetical protein
MFKIKVYRFEYFDRVSRVWARSQHLATTTAIEHIGGVPIPDSEIEVDASAVAPNGLVRSKGE